MLDSMLTAPKLSQEHLEALDTLGPNHPVSKFVNAARSLTSTVNPSTGANHTVAEAIGKTIHILPKTQHEAAMAVATRSPGGGVNVEGSAPLVTRDTVRDLQTAAGMPRSQSQASGRKARKLAAQGRSVDSRGQGGSSGGEQEWSRQADMENVMRELQLPVAPSEITPVQYFPAPNPEQYSAAVDIQKATANRFAELNGPERTEATLAKQIVYGETVGGGERSAASEAQQLPEGSPLEGVRGAGTRLNVNADIVDYLKGREMVLGGNAKGRGKMEAARIRHGNNLANMRLTEGNVDTHIRLRTTGSGERSRLLGTTPDLTFCRTTGCMSDPWAYGGEEIRSEGQPVDSTLCPTCNSALSGQGDMSHLLPGETVVDRTKALPSAIRARGERPIVTAGEGAGRPMSEVYAEMPGLAREVTPPSVVKEGGAHYFTSPLEAKKAVGWDQLVKALEKDRAAQPGQGDALQRSGSGRTITRISGQSLPGGSATNEEQAGAAELSRRLASGEIGDNQ